ncbi:MAG: twin-arginine translocation signal domain-containing protein [Anaerolineae bacterium]|nr:twin-arginine translocation signal domain-containing protein [Anaerolineae bacterium]
MKKLSRREFLRVGATVAAGATLAPYIAQADEAVVSNAPAARQGVTIQYWPSWSNFPPAWEKMVETDEYKEFVGDNTVEVKTGTPWEAVLTAIAAGTPPDAVSNYQYLDLMARGVLRPIDDWVAASEYFKKELYFEGSWNDGFYQGVMYGAPGIEGFLRYGLNYNAKMVEDAGLDPDNPPQTWEGCLEWHEALTKFDDAGNLTQMGLDPYDAMGGQIAIQDGFYPPVSWGWKWFDADAGTFNIANDMMIEAFDVMGEFYRIAGPDNVAGIRSVEGQGGWGGSFNASVQAMIIEGYWHPGETIIQKPEVGQYNRATWAPVPTAREGAKVQGTGGHYVVFFKDAANTEPMFKIAEFFQTDTACQILFEDVGWLPARIPFIEKTDPSAFPGLEFYFDSVTEATEWSSPARCPITAYVSQQYQELREKVFRDELSAADAAAEFQTRCEDEYKMAGF